jgi:hypothetical protein
MMNARTIIFAFVMAAAVLLVTGCSTTVPVKAKFPEAPSIVKDKCPQLEKIKEDSKLSDIAKTISNNYTTYYECAVKNDAWLEWYEIQKNIYESVK